MHVRSQRINSKWPNPTIFLSLVKRRLSGEFTAFDLASSCLSSLWGCSGPTCLLTATLLLRTPHVVVSYPPSSLAKPHFYASVFLSVLISFLLVIVNLFENKSYSAPIPPYVHFLHACTCVKIGDQHWGGGLPQLLSSVFCETRSLTKPGIYWFG